MNRMTKTFSKMKERKEKVNVLYFPLGDPILGDSLEAAKNYFNCGCTVLEIGLPNDNPVLDGPTVADSMHRALEKVSLDECWELIKKIREQNPDKILQPIVYHMIIEKYGEEGFAKKCHEADVDAVLCPNMDKAQTKALEKALEPYDIITLRFKPFNLSQEDIEDCAKNAKGYIFSQAVDGGTGTRSNVEPHVAENVKILHDCGTKALVIPGFGISNAQQATEVLNMGADGFVIGSATIKHVQAGDYQDFIKGVHKICLPQ